MDQKLMMREIKAIESAHTNNAHDVGNGDIEAPSMTEVEISRNGGEVSAMENGLPTIIPATTTTTTTQQSSESDSAPTIIPATTTTTPSQQSESDSAPNSTMKGINIITKQGVLVAFFTVFSSSAFGGLVALKDSKSGREVLRLGLRDILHPELLPHNFFTILLLTILFTVCLVLALNSVWSMIRKERSTCFLALLFVGVASFFLSYAFITKEKLPKFYVGNISGFWLLWTYGLFVTLIVVTIFHAAKQFLSTFSKSNQPDDDEDDDE